jgi:5-methylcytosine-specific restriction enzyme subunit McrC
MFLLGYATDPHGWRDAIAEFESDPDLLPAIASGFAFHAYRAVEPGPLRGYVRVEESSAALRGRLRVADQLARTLPLPLEIAYDDYTVDITENQILRGAVEVLLRFPRIPLAARKRLLRSRAALEAVQAATAPLAVPPVTRLNQRYQPALRLADLILKSASISTSSGGISSTAFVFDMNRVFEDFLARALSESFGRFGGSVRLQYGQQHLDQEGKLRLRPDITWWREGRIRALIDAKYKRLINARFPNADAYQMLAYCRGFGLNEGFLVYARDLEERPRNHHLRDAQTVIRVRTVDVETEPDALLEQVDKLAEEIVWMPSTTESARRSPHVARAVATVARSD